MQAERSGYSSSVVAQKRKVESERLGCGAVLGYPLRRYRRSARPSLNQGGQKVLKLAQLRT